MTRARDLGDFIADGGAPELVVDTTTLVVDSTNNRVGIGTASPATALDVVGNATITVADNSDALTIVSTDADASVGPVLNLYRNSASPADNDVLGRIIFKGEDDAGNAATFARIEATATDVSNGSEDGRIDFITAKDDSFSAALSVLGDKIGVGTTSPKRHLHVNGGNESTKIQITNQTTGSASDGDGFQLGIATNGTANIEQRENADMLFTTNNTERFRFGSSGQLGIGGATYGTSGQVLTSGGSGAAPTWADAGGGGSIELTASEGISAGAVVSLKSNGQSQLIGYASDATNVSTETKTSTSTSIDYPAAAYDPDTQKVGVVYSDSAARAQAAIFSPSGFGGSFGSATQILSDQDAQQHKMVYDTTYNQFVGIHRMTSDNTGKYFVLSTNGSTMTVDAGNANFEGSEVTHLSMDIDQTNARVFVAYRHSDNSSKGTVIAGTLSNGNVSWGSGHVFQSSGDTESPAVAWNSTSNVLLVAFKSGLANDLRVYAATVSGTTFTDRNNYSTSQNVSNCMAVADPVNSTAGNAVFHVAFYGGNGIQIFRQSFNTSSWSGSSSSIAYMSSSDPSGFSQPYNGRASLHRDPLTGRLYLFTQQSSALFEIEYNAVTDSYTYEKKTGASSWMVNAETINRFGTTQDTNTGTIYNVLKDGSNNLGMQTASVSNVNAFLGVSESTVTSGNTHKVTVISGVNEAVSGLTPGSTYYLTGTGALTTTDTGIKIGKALAANKLYIDSTGD
jgi:hypothetical protein